MYHINVLITAGRKRGRRDSEEEEDLEGVTIVVLVVIIPFNSSIARIGQHSLYYCEAITSDFTKGYKRQVHLVSDARAACVHSPFEFWNGYNRVTTITRN